jgi:arylsulfatase A-like enzyme
VPLFVTGRNVDLLRGRTSDALVGWEDLMPTVLDLAGVPIPGGLDGQSLVPILRGEPTGVRNEIHGVCLDRTPYRSVVAGRYKYVWFTKTNEEQLFDVIGDPNECHDLSADAELLAPMRDRMQPVAQRTKLDYDRAKLTPCQNQTPQALGYPA